MNNDITERVLSGLKDFQRDTVDYAFRRMYQETPPATRFLIADEVGLGKTKVAAGIVARAIDHIRASDPTRRIDIVYICSNSNIARQNINRLNVTKSRCEDLPDRITLLPREIGRLKENKVNFIAFTPGTSLNIRSSGGRSSERTLLYWLLPSSWKVNEKGTVSLLTGGMGRQRFKERLEEHGRFSIDRDLAERFRARIDVAEPGAVEPVGLRDRFIRLAEQLGRRSELTDEEASERNRIVGELRGILAGVCVDSLEPDLVILDEFQRFSDVLYGEDDASRLARKLFEYRDERAAGSDARVLLLSATPYRMFTSADDAEGDGHYQDLIRTVGFLQNDPAATQKFDTALTAYGRELFRIGEAGCSDGLLKARSDVAEMLRRVMVRTERLAVTADRSGMLKEVSAARMDVTDGDIKSYLAMQGLARSLESCDVGEYWKSAPYLVNFMDDYELKRDFEDAAKGKGLSPESVEALVQGDGALLSKTDIAAYRQIDPGNARLRSLMHDMVDSEAWRLLWVPAAWPYYQPAGEFSASSLAGFTKRLIFSSWQVVPKVVASLTTYEVERRMMGIDPAGKSGSNEAGAREKHGGLLKFSMDGARVGGMSALGLLYPSTSLALMCDPLAGAYGALGRALPTLEEALAAARRSSEELLAMLGPASSTGPVDEQWYWAAPILLDAIVNPQATKTWFGQAGLGDIWRQAVDAEESSVQAPSDIGTDAPGAWDRHVERARQVLEDGAASLGRRPDDLADVLAHLALGSPAILALRAMARVSGGLQLVVNSDLRNRAGQVAEGFRSLFNQADVTVMLQNIEKGDYWKRTLEYAARGGLQAVLDEFAHVLSEHLGVADRAGNEIAEAISAQMRKALTLRAANVSADAIHVDSETRQVSFADNDIRFRTRFAVRYGAKDVEETGAVMRAGDVQKAFNSPFWPFVLCSTSVGQEGLDFHLYCHAVMHWNLPSNPVDFEQREGRVHRYKGHAVRKNVAMNYSHTARYQTEGPDSDSWRQAFEAARQNRRSSSDLEPFWVYAPEGGAKIERHLPMIPLSKDVARADGLRRSLAVYRMAFGQSRQDELAQFLRQRLKTEEQIAKTSEELRIDLTPDLSPDRGRSSAPPTPGGLAIAESATTSLPRTAGLDALNDLLDSFVAIHPEKNAPSLTRMANLLDEFSSLLKTH